jgi:hypothetical protein
MYNCEHIFIDQRVRVHKRCHILEQSGATTDEALVHRPLLRQHLKVRVVLFTYMHIQKTSARE